MFSKELERDVKKILEDDVLGVWKDEHGELYLDVYADYRDVMDDKTAIEILESKDPMMDLEDTLYDWYAESVAYDEDQMVSEVMKLLDEEKYPDLDEDDLAWRIRDMVYFKYPVDHYLDQEFYVDILIDTGDGNYDYTLNSVYPCWYGREEDRIDSKAGIVWLAKTQGYNKTQLWKALKDGDMAAPKGFLESMRVELANLPSHMSTVTFLVKMTLRDLIALNEALHWREPDGKRVYDPKEYPYCGYIVLGKDTETGLYDPWAGGGSVFEIQLEKDVRLPIKYIRSALPDARHGMMCYSVEEVYGMCGSAWRDTLKEMHFPKKMKEAV